MGAGSTLMRRAAADQRETRIRAGELLLTQFVNAVE